MSLDGEVRASAPITAELILPTKLRVPVPVEPCLDRHPLLAAIDAAAEPPRRLLVTGPAGAGKTTLLAQWCRQLDQQSLVLWLTIDEQDRDPVRLWAHLLHGAQSWVPGLGAEALAALEAGAPVAEVVLPLLIRDLGAVDGPVVIVLDDVHALPDGEALSSLDALAEHIPPGTTLAVSSRYGLRNEQTRWVFNDQARHIAAPDLRFSAAEVSALAKELSGTLLSSAEADLLEEYTGGWAAPLRFACRQLGNEGLAAALRALGEVDVEDYIVGQVLSAAQDAPEPSLVLLAHLDRFNHAFLADLAPACSDLLDPARREALCVRHLGDGWFAFHDLVRDVIRKRAGHVAPPTELVAAARWFADRGHLEEAARYATVGGSYDFAAEILNRMWPTYVETGRLGTLRGLLEALPAEHVYGNPAHLVTSAWLAAFTHDLPERDRLLDAADDFDSTSKLPDGSESLAHAAALNRCLTPGDYQTLAANADLARALTPIDSPWMGVALMGAGTASLADGEYLSCARDYLDAAARTTPLFRVACIGGAALAFGLSGDLGRAEELADAAQDLRARSDLGAIPWLVFHEVAKGYVALRRGSPTEAIGCFEAAEPGLAELIEPYPLLATLLGAAESHALLGDRKAALDALVRADARAATAGDIGDHFERLLAEARSSYSAERPLAHAMSVEPLTNRELRVLRLLATTQLSQAEIAETLYVSHNTVKTHTRTIYRKLHVRSRGRAAQRANELGLLPRTLPTVS